MKEKKRRRNEKEQIKFICFFFLQSKLNIENEKVILSNMYETETNEL